MAAAREGARPLGVNTYGYIWSTPAEQCVLRLGELGYREFELVLNPPHLALEEFPSSARARLRNPFAPLYDLSHAATRLGFVPEYDQRHLLAGLPGFEN